MMLGEYCCIEQCLCPPNACASHIHISLFRDSENTHKCEEAAQLQSLFMTGIGCQKLNWDIPAALLVAI